MWAKIGLAKVAFGRREGHLVGSGGTLSPKLDETSCDGGPSWPAGCDHLEAEVRGYLGA